MAFGVLHAYIMLVGCGTIATATVQPCQLTYAHNIPNAVCALITEDEQVMLETCRGPWFSINWMKSASRWFYYTDILWCTVSITLRKTVSDLVHKNFCWNYQTKESYKTLNRTLNMTQSHTYSNMRDSASHFPYHITHSVAQWVNYRLKVQTHWIFMIIIAFLLTWHCISYSAHVVSLKELEGQLLMNWGGSGHGLLLLLLLLLFFFFFFFSFFFYWRGQREPCLSHFSLRGNLYFNTALVPPFISRGAPRQTAWETSVSERRNYGQEMASQI
jgi:hypothetical protein